MEDVRVASPMSHVDWGNSISITKSGDSNQALNQLYFLCEHEGANVE